MTTVPHFLTIKDLKVHFQARKGLFHTVTVRALDGVSLALAKGETLAVVGESGSGKTTLGRATLGLVNPTAGHVLFVGQAIDQLKGKALAAFRRQAQGIFQDPYASISPFMNVYQIVEEPLLVHGHRARKEREERAFWALEQVKLRPAGEFASKYPHTLSGGQRQRVGIARALVLEPSYVVADEPVSMIDASNRAEILSLLRELQDQHGITFLYITHDFASVRHFSDRIAVMYLGTVVELGPAREVIDGPLHPYTKALIAAVPEPDPENRARMRQVVPGEPPSGAAVPPGCPFHPRCPAFMAGKCDGARPVLKEVSPGHAVACFLFE